MILKAEDIFYSKERDGEYPTVERPACPIAFVINNEVVFAHGFSPSIGDNIFLANPKYSSRIEIIDDVETEIVIAEVNGVITEMILDELFTSVLLSDALAVPISRTTSLYVNTGWKHDENGFFQTQFIQGVEKRINGMGVVVS